MTGSARTGVAVTNEALSPRTASEVLDLAVLGEEADGVAPLSEQAILRVRHAHPRAFHFLARRHPDDGADTAADVGSDRGASAIVGYLLLQPGGAEDADDLVAELVVHPDARRHGVGGALIEAALASAAGEHRRSILRIWAHGDRPDAAALAERLGFTRDRILLQMHRSTSLDLPDVPTPDGVRIRTFRPGEDDEAWVALNAAAFAGHPEQAYVTIDDLRERQEEDWFDPAGFFLAERIDDGELAGFHWTKVHRRPERVGEVYVVGVHPSDRGTGLGLALTVIGLDHLARLGLPAVILYADETNTGAVRMYERLGFHISNTDVEYARPVVAGPT